MASVALNWPDIIMRYLLPPSAFVGLWAWIRAVARRRREMKPQLRIDAATSHLYKREPNELQYAALKLVNEPPVDLAGFHASLSFEYRAIRGGDRSLHTATVPFAEMYIVDADGDKIKRTLALLPAGYEARIRLAEWNQEHCYIVTPSETQTAELFEGSCRCVVTFSADNRRLPAKIFTSKIPARSATSVIPITFTEYRPMWRYTVLGW